MNLLVIVLIVGFASSTAALSCSPCNVTACSSVDCEGSVYADPCNCCPMCAKQRGESCGGPFDIEGLCDEENGLECVKFVGPDDLPFNVIGTCFPNGTSDLCSYPYKYSDCLSACQPNCRQRSFDFCILICAEGPCECGPGFIRRSPTNDTCIPIDTCEDVEPSCEHPKVFEECPSACPPTCENPYPFICTRQCNNDQCVCPSGYLMSNGTTCVEDYKCANFSFCERECPPLNISASADMWRVAWSCHMNDWRCTSYKWKMEMTKWWVGNCNEERQTIDKYWNSVDHECIAPSADICKNEAATQCGTDAFGCQICECSDGKYSDPKKLLATWIRTFGLYREYMRIYKEAKEACLMV